MITRKAAGVRVVTEVENMRRRGEEDRERENENESRTGY
jgi:hypothetical protein